MSFKLNVELWKSLVRAGYKIIRTRRLKTTEDKRKIEAKTEWPIVALNFKKYSADSVRLVAFEELFVIEGQKGWRPNFCHLWSCCNLVASACVWSSKLIRCLYFSMSLR